MEEHDRIADELERDAERLDEESSKLKDHIDKTRSDWESKQQDEAVPGAQPEPGEDDDDER